MKRAAMKEAASTHWKDAQSFAEAGSDRMTDGKSQPTINPHTHTHCLGTVELVYNFVAVILPLPRWGSMLAAATVTQGES